MEPTDIMDPVVELDPVTAFLLHDHQSAIVEEPRVSDEFKDVPPPRVLWDTPPWAADCFGTPGHYHETCDRCKAALDRWMDEGFEDFTEDEEPTPTVN